MKKFQSQPARLLFVLFVVTVNVFSQNNTPSAQAATDAETGEKVRVAFEQAIKDNFKPLKEIKSYGKKIVPYLEPYLNDSDLGVRVLAVGLLDNVKEPEYLPLLATALRNSEKGVSRRAALYLYDNYDHQTLARNIAIGDGLRQSAANGNGSFSLILLLGYFPALETEEALLTIPADTDTRYWTENREITFGSEILTTVPVHLSLYRINKEKYHLSFADLIRKASPGEIEFLLFTLNYINDPALLKLIFEKGIAVRKVLPSGYGNHGELLSNSLRLADLTVNTFAEKLDLNLGFERQETAYAAKKLALAKQKIAERVNSK
jgi:hypothetical protein